MVNGLLTRDSDVPMVLDLILGFYAELAATTERENTPTFDMPFYSSEPTE